ncbi:hypothetical protein pb186bvf_009412 [Paramecium bursaria]
MSHQIAILNPDVTDQEQYAQYYNMETQLDPNVQAVDNQERPNLLIEVDNKESEEFSKDILKYLIKFLVGLICSLSLSFIDIFNQIFVTYDYTYVWQNQSFQQYCRREYYWDPKSCDNSSLNDYWYQRFYQQYLKEVQSVNVHLGPTFIVGLVLLAILSFGVVILRNQQLTQRYQYYLRNTHCGLLIFIFTALISSIPGRTWDSSPDNRGKIISIIGLAVVTFLLTFTTFLKDRIPKIRDIQPMDFVKQFVLFTLMLNTILILIVDRFPKIILLFEIEIIYGVYYFYQLNNSITQRTNYKRNSFCQYMCSKVTQWRSNPSTAQPEIDPQIIQQVKQQYLLINKKYLSKIIGFVSILSALLIFGNSCIFLILGYILASLFLETQVVTNLGDDNPPIKNQNVQIAQMIFWIDIISSDQSENEQYNQYHKIISYNFKRADVIDLVTINFSHSVISQLEIFELILLQQYEQIKQIKRQIK